MDALSIIEVDVLKALSIHFDRKLTWSHMINQFASQSVSMATSFLWVLSITHLHKLDLAQNMAERMCNTTFLLLASHQNASSISHFCKLLDLQCREPLQKCYAYFSYRCIFLSPCY